MVGEQGPPGRNLVHPLFLRLVQPPFEVKALVWLGMVWWGLGCPQSGLLPNWSDWSGMVPSLETTKIKEGREVLLGSNVMEQTMYGFDQLNSNAVIPYLIRNVFCGFFLLLFLYYTWWEWHVVAGSETQLKL